MSRIARRPVSIPTGTTVEIKENDITVKGAQGVLSRTFNPLVRIVESDNQIQVEAVDSSKEAKTQSGTARALLNNMVIGVSQGFEKKLQLVGVGYRAKAQGKMINLTLGFSHPVSHSLPEGVTVETPSQTEIVLKSADKQLLGEVAANIRGYRPPEPYKGKGVRYADERIVTKEAKKK
ncbi:50S ribosomal protein L6 [Thiotrichales bacterium 19S11-10]|nr:50S ribosomal protein L6 [Thiotrichales bacterium 19S11-10]MCF6807621.1 50S ribosomal protein L6 [Thiotrichales bacterium 19S9-11]MCF6811590.1 50S ribosomal protein L6 [Thiotrichales bacterium 19S9-12]